MWKTIILRHKGIKKSLKSVKMKQRYKRRHEIKMI